MFPFIIKRLLWFIPISLFVLMLIYLMYNKTSTDKLIQLTGQETALSTPITEQIIRSTAAELHLEKASFYFTFDPVALPAYYYQVYNPNRKRWIEAFALYTGDKEMALQAFHLFENIVSTPGFTNLRYLESITALQAALRNSDLLILKKNLYFNIHIYQ